MGIKKAIITGGSRGIGRGIALALAAEGYDVAINYTSAEEDALKVKAEIKEKFGRECHVFSARLEQPGAGVELFNKAVQALGGVDVMVNNAGVTKFESLLQITEETMDFLINLDFKNYILMAREAARHMVRNGVKGSIINITSSRGERAYPGDGIYGGLKAGLNRAIQSFALDLAPHGIRINNVAPGAIRIRSAEELADMAKSGVDVPTDFWDELGGRIPMERSGLPEDIGHAVAYLASDKASYITGVTLRVDGGLILAGMPEKPDPEANGWGGSKVTDF